LRKNNIKQIYHKKGGFQMSAVMKKKKKKKKKKKMTEKINATVIEVTDETFVQEVDNFKGLVILDIFTEWCGPCKMLAPIIEVLAQENTNPKVKIAKLDAGGQEKARSTVALELGIMSIPMVLVFKNGKEVERLRGAQEKWRLEKAIKDHL